MAEDDTTQYPWTQVGWEYVDGRFQWFERRILQPTMSAEAKWDATPSVFDVFDED